MGFIAQVFSACERAGLRPDGAIFSTLQIDATQWSVNSANGTIHDLISLANGASIDASDVTFIAGAGPAAIEAGFELMELAPVPIDLNIGFPQAVFEVLTGISAGQLHVGAGIESDFQLMELVNHKTVAAIDGFDDHSLMGTGQEQGPIDMAGHASLLPGAHDLLAGMDTTRPGGHQIAADYALLHI